MRRIMAQAVSIVLVLASGAVAAPLELKQVAADAKWLAHLDLDAVRASTVVQKAWQKGMEKHKDAQTKLDFVRTMLNMDPTKDVHGITFYGQQIGKPAGVAIVSAAMDPDRILGLTAAISGRETTRHGDCDIHCWTRKRHEHTWAIAAAFRGKDQLVVGNSVESVKAALDVLAGKSPGLTADAKLAGHVPAGTTILLRAEGIAEADLHCCKAPVVKQIDSFRLVSGETEGQSFFRARVTMTNPEAAAQGLAVLQGGKAQGNLFCADELGRKLINALNPKAEGPALTILWTASADDVWEETQKIEKLVARRIAQRKHGGGKHRHGAEKPGGGDKKPVSPEEDF